MDSIEDKERARQTILVALYGESGGDPFALVNIYDLGEPNGLSRDEVESCIEYLVGEGMAKYMTKGGNVSITHEGVVTLGELWERYRHEAPSFLDNEEKSRKEAAGRADILLGHFGDGCDVSKLTEHDVRMYEAKRRAGGIIRKNGQVTRPVRATSPWADLVLLRTTLRWATTVRTKSGERWLHDNPLHGIQFKREQNPRRPVATWERYTATRKAMNELAKQAKPGIKQDLWIRMELALLLAQATGRRLGSIINLQWEDIDFQQREIRWRAQFDKKRRESVVPMTEDLADEIKDFRRQLGAIGGLVFPRQSDGMKPTDRHLFDKWLKVAERHAELPKLDFGTWHPYRRMWATARAHLPRKQVAVAGGWRDTETLERCYQQPDKQSLLTVMADQTRVHENVLGQ